MYDLLGKHDCEASISTSQATLCIFYNFPGKSFKSSVVYYIFIIELYPGTQFKLTLFEKELRLSSFPKSVLCLSWIWTPWVWAPCTNHVFSSKFNGTRILLSELSLNFCFHCGLPLLLLPRTELPMKYFLISGKKLGNNHIPGNAG